jgi:hypothetical protein
MIALLGQGTSRRIPSSLKKISTKPAVQVKHSEGYFTIR